MSAISRYLFEYLGAVELVVGRDVWLYDGGEHQGAPFVRSEFDRLFILAL